MLIIHLNFEPYADSKDASRYQPTQIVIKKQTATFKTMLTAMQKCKFEFNLQSWNQSDKTFNDSITSLTLKEVRIRFLSTPISPVAEFKWSEGYQLPGPSPESLG